MTEKNYSDYELYRRLLRQVKPYSRHLTILFVVSLLAVPLALLLPLPLKLAVDNVLGGKPLPNILAVVVPDLVTASAFSLMLGVACLLLAIGLLIQLQVLAAWVLNTYIGEKLVLEFRAVILRHLQRMSLSYHDTKGAADSIYRLQYDATAVQMFSLHGLIPMLSSLLTLVAMICVIAAFNWRIALIAIAVCPVLYVVTNISRKRLRSTWDAVKRIQSSSMSAAQEGLSVIRVVKAFNQEEREHSRFVDLSQQSVSGEVQVAYTQGRFDILVGLTMIAGEAAVLFVGVQQVSAGALSLGALLVIMAYLAQLYQPLRQISKNINHLQSALVSAARVFSVLDEPHEVVEKPNARACRRARGELRFENVSFSYEPQYLVLENVDFEIHAGARVGIAGKTGAGKTTLINLIARFYDPTQGRISLDGVDLRDYKIADLRRQIALVLQDTVLFSTSVRENIAYAKADTSEESIVAAAKAAEAHGFIMELPQGYDTQVGERGMLLSGGQRQRISLARAFLKNAPILILDEPTSAVDESTEAAILRAMERLMENRTTLIITHRPSLFRYCDSILTIENKRLSRRSTTGILNTVLSSATL